MQASEFVQRLRALMPATAVLEEYGLSAEEIAEIQATFAAEERPVDEVSGQNELEILLQQYDCSRLSVGLVQFESSVRSHAAGTLFAHCEADPLVVTESGEVRMVDHAQPTASLGCARSAERFLDGLAYAANAIANRSLWAGKGNEVARNGADLAGGQQYHEFFQILCGNL